MKFNFPFLSMLVVLAGLITACQPEPVEPDPVPPVYTPPTGNAVLLSFENVVGADSLVLDQQLRYANLNGDSFSVELMKYYISNISFTDNLGNTWYEPESYHLVDAADPNSLKFYIANMPAGNYVSVNFMIGVDSARNVSGTQTGALDPVHGMFWTWSSGYIMAKMEGRSPSSTQSFDLVIFHIGGFSGQYAGQRWASPSFNSLTANVTGSTVPKIKLKADLNEWFQGPNIIDFSSMNNINTPGNNSVRIADNYADMFTVTAIEN